MMKRLTRCLIVFGIALTAFAQSESVELTINKPLARELKAGESHNFQLKLAANQTAHIVVMQQGVDAQVNVYDPAGKRFIEMDSPNGAQGAEPVWLVNQPAGVYRVEVLPFTGEGQAGRGGKYEIKLVELRAATAADAKLGQAQAAFVEAKALRPGQQPANRKAAAAKLAEAARLLGENGDPDLTASVNQMLFNVAPMFKVEQMKLTKVPGMVTTYHSADLAKEAMEKRALLESLLNFYQPLLNTKFDMSFAMLNQQDWKQLCPVCPYMMPLVAPEPLTFIQSNDTQAAKGMLSMFKSKVPASLNSALAAEGLTYDTAIPVVLEAAGYLGIAGAINNQAAGSAPNAGIKPWMPSVMVGYFVHAWLGEKHPQLRKQIKLGLQLPGAVLTPANRTLDGMFTSNDMFTGGVAMSRAADLGSDLYDKHKLGFLTEVLKAFPKGAPVDAATAEARFIALSPLIKPWMESFGYTGVALEIRQAEEALVAARKAKDAAAFDRLVANTYTGLNQYGQQRDVAGFRMSATGPNPVAVFTLDRTDIEITGDLAIVRGAQTEQWQGGALEHHLFTRIWVKREGRWQLLSNTQFIDPNRK